MNNAIKNEFEKIDAFISNIAGVNRLVNAVADLVLPTTVARASCSGCSSTHCGWACIDGVGYELFRDYNTSQCCCYDCWRYCSQATPIGC
jgi:hypothetical protein